MTRTLPICPVDEDKVNWNPAEYEGKPNPNHLKMNLKFILSSCNDLLTSGSSKIGIRMRKLQTMKKTMGRTMFTLIGRSRSGCFHL